MLKSGISCRRRDPIYRGICVEWTLEYQILGGITIGIIKARIDDGGDTNVYNAEADDDCLPMFMALIIVKILFITVKILNMNGGCQ